MTDAPPTQLDAAARLVIATLVGIGVGLEREWSGHAAGPQARFAGLRTFLLLGLLGGVAGLLAAVGAAATAAVLAAGGVALAVSAYVMAVRRPHAEPDGTTEAAALVVLAIGAVAGMGWIALAAAAGSIVVLILSEKARLHWLVKRVGEQELSAALQFAVLALVVLPLLPEGPYWGWLAFRPRALWIAVLIFSGLNFAGFLARRAVGPGHGYGITGMLGGVVSSTLVTLQFSRESRTHSARSAALATGVVGACTVLLPRVTVLSAAFNPAVTAALVPLIAIPTLIGALLTVFFWRAGTDAPPREKAESGTPLNLWAAVRLAVMFQAAITVLALVRDRWGASGLYATAAMLGLTDVDALTAAMSRPDAGLVAANAARAIAVGILANTGLKLTLSLTLGSPAFRLRAGSGLALLGVASALGLWLF